MLRAKQPRGERGVLVVPVRPGSLLEPGTRRRRRRRGRRAAAALAIAVCAGGAAGAVLLTRGSSRPRAVEPATAAVATVPPARPPAAPRPTADARARAAAARIVRRLPVPLASAALLVRGDTAFVVGGTARGTPTDGIWAVDLRTGRVRRAGTFVEPLAGSGSAARGGALYLAGGWTGTQAATGVLRWTPNGPETLVTRLPVALRHARAAFAGSTLYVSGGGKAFAVDVDAASVRSTTTQPRAVSNLALLVRAIRALR